MHILPVLIVATWTVTAVPTLVEGVEFDEGAAIERSRSFLETEGVRWIERRKCSSCHQIPFMLWSLDAARDAGAEVAAEKLDGWRDWSVSQLLSEVKPRARDGEKEREAAASDGTTLEPKGPSPQNEEAEVPVADAGAESDARELVATRNTEGLSWLIVGGVVRDEATLERFAEILVSTQTDDGSWKPQGQLPGQRAGAAEARAVSTMLSVLALGEIRREIQRDAHESRSAEKEDSALVDDARRRGLSWLEKNSAADGLRASNDSLALRILLALDESQPTEALVGELFKRQNEDGGWGFLAADASDAYGSGQSLYVLRRALGAASSSLDDEGGVRANERERRLQKAVSFLLRTQTEDGAWDVPSTLKRKDGSIEPTSRYWGTAWAVIGLAAQPRD